MGKTDWTEYKALAVHAESLFLQKVLKASGRATKRGWPNFFVEDKRGNVAIVEVKPTPGRRLSIAQSRVMSYLISKGVPCFLYTPETGLVRLKAGSWRLDRHAKKGDEDESEG